MPKYFRALATRAAVVATAAAATAIVTALPATETPAPAVASPAVPVAPAAPAVVPVAKITPAPADASKAARSSALKRAMSKIGSPYRWGAEGPKAFDCSGLVWWAYKKEGISLPRTSKAMSKVGKPVSKSDLRPGDLVFFYKPVSHVGIYIGDGKIVHASNRKSPVKISSMRGMQFNSARRL